MKTRLFVLLVLPFCINSLSAQKHTAETDKKYISVHDGYLMVLREGDNVFEQLELLAIREKVPSANLSGMGFAGVELGFYDFKRKKYRPRKFKAAEIAALNGSIAWQSGHPSIHLHGVIAGKNFKAYGGHILSAIVGKGSLEIMILVHSKHLERVKDELLGANIICLDKCK